MSLFLTRREIKFEVATVGGSFPSRGCYFRDFLTTVKCYRYFRIVASFRGKRDVGGRGHFQELTRNRTQRF